MLLISGNILLETCFLLLFIVGIMFYLINGINIFLGNFVNGIYYMSLLIMTHNIDNLMFICIQTIAMCLVSTVLALTFMKICYEVSLSLRHAQGKA